MASNSIIFSTFTTWLPMIRRNFLFFPTYLFTSVSLDSRLVNLIQWLQFFGLIFNFDVQILLDVTSRSSLRLAHVPFWYVPFRFLAPYYFLAQKELQVHLVLSLKSAISTRNGSAFLLLNNFEMSHSEHDTFVELISGRPRPGHHSHCSQSLWYVQMVQYGGLVLREI